MRPIEDQDLHAYVDGEIDQERRIEVEAWLARNPADAERVRAWAAQNRLLHAHLDDVLNEPMPQRLLQAASRTPPAWWGLTRLAANLTVVVLAVFGGYLLGTRSTPREIVTLVDQLPRAAAIAHAVYVPEKLHPVEVTAADTAHLVTWLSKRLDRKLKAPDFAAAGFELLGGRLLSGERGPVALFMYQDADAHRVTLYVRREAPDADEAESSFRYEVDDGVGVFYWIEGRSGYALSGELDKKTLLGLATLAYRQLSGD
jgi:anti-sigma factor RsiW